MQEDRQQKTDFLSVYDAVVYDDCKPYMQGHGKKTLNDVHGHHGEIKRGGRLNRRKRCGGGFLCDVQGPESVFRISRRKHDCHGKIGDHRGQDHRQNLDPAVADTVQNSIFAGAVLLHDVFHDEVPPAFFENARHGDPVKDKSERVSVYKPGNGIIRKDAEIMYAKLQHAGRKDETDYTGNEPADICLIFMSPAPADEEDDRDRDHQSDGDDQRWNAAFTDDDALKRGHCPSPPQTSTQKPL